MGLCSAGFAAGQTAVDPVEVRLERLAGHNRELQEQVRAQQQQIEELRAMVAGLNRSGQRQDQELKELRTQFAEEPVPARTRSNAPAREVRVSGEVGLGFFRTGAGGGATSPSSPRTPIKYTL